MGWQSCCHLQIKTFIISIILLIISAKQSHGCGIFASFFSWRIRITRIEACCSWLDVISLLELQLLNYNLRIFLQMLPWHWLLFQISNITFLLIKIPQYLGDLIKYSCFKLIRILFTFQVKLKFSSFFMELL